MAASLADYEWLTSDSALPYLARAAEDDAELHRVIASLRKELSAERAHLVVEQVELRRRAREKFSRADHMFFTRKGLEQATDEQVAAYKAGRFLLRGVTVDICCGIGGDLIALAKAQDPEYRAMAIGLDRDPVISHFARRNLAVNDCGASLVLENDAEEFTPLDQVHTWHCDPDRRSEGHRTTQAEQFSPSAFLLKQWAFMNTSGAVKLAPATELAADWANTCEREWISSRGECRQQVAWFQYQARRTATVIAKDGRTRTVAEDPNAELTLASTPQRYVFEADAALLAARISASLACEYDLTALTTDEGYLTGDSRIEDLALAAFEVQEVLPWNLKSVKALLRERGIGRLEIKKRGVDLDPERLRKQLELRGEHAATLLIARANQSTIAVLAHRMT